MMRRFDVVIVGAGPAGSTAAVALARRGYAVALLDRETFPRDKLCGDFIHGANWTVFQELGVDREILSKKPEKISTVRITAPSGHEAIAPIPHRHNEGYGLGLSRYELDQVLMQAAAKEGVTVLQNHRGQKLTKHADAWRIAAGPKDALAVLEAKVLIGADGRNSWVAHRVGLAALSSWRGKAVGLQFRLKDFAKISGRVEIHVLPDGYAGLVQLGDGTANLCLALTRDNLSNGPRVDSPARFNFSRNPFLQELLSGAEFLQGVRSVFPIYFSPRRCYTEGLLLVGDAAQVSEPVTGEGIYFATSSALLAARTVDEAFQRKDFSASYLRQYERRCRRAFRRRRALNRVIQHLIYRPALLGQLVRFSSKQNALLGAIINSIFLSGEVERLSTL